MENPVNIPVRYPASRGEAQMNVAAKVRPVARSIETGRNKSPCAAPFEHTRLSNAARCRLHR